ncbi:hypothetical protein GGP57_000988 [Salinibacter ruber]|uniref:O-methyltransferase n=1 Tax=Salinibacter ruber TaxID=146919 RepID=UPI00216739F5|nr:O-methyltransferase [Salinibacter ruber]MCS3633697.1 hypothetical protein [Salinibacter ruber]MCS3712527.1 hypothetical protein [Salinibacter ruber]
MSSSTDKVDFSVRPNKNVERKLIFEAISEIGRDFRIDKYKYVGLGSIWFIDFVMAHKRLSIDEMVSMENDPKTYIRADFNKPFSCIEIDDKLSSDALSEIDFDERPVLAWMDYDSDIAGPFFEDFDILCREAQSGSVILATMNAHPNHFLDPKANPRSVLDQVESILSGDQDADQKVEAIAERIEDHGDRHQQRMDGLEDEINGDLIPFGLEPADLSVSNTPSVISDILTNAIEENLQQYDRDARYVDLFNFSYRDGAPMVTIGGMIADDEDRTKLEESTVWEMEYVSQDGEQTEIDLPNLTLKEKNQLDKMLPELKESDITESFVENRLNFELSEEEIISYIKYYKQYPNFMETKR